MTFLLATRNHSKVREFQRLLKGRSIRLVPLDRFPQIPPVEEDGSTFRDNAVRKALATSCQTILPVVAEDSGLTVRALQGSPGVRSARFAAPFPKGAGDKEKDRANVAKCLDRMQGIPLSQRQARFVCFIALAAGGRLIRTFQGSCEGSISLSPAGRTGFGYDPIFIPGGFQKTMAQLGPNPKDRLSHRARAARQMCAWLKAKGVRPPKRGP